MRLDGAGISGELRVVKVLRNGKRRFDPVEKERLIDACLEPGVPVAGLALKYGVNASCATGSSCVSAGRRRER